MGKHANSLQYKIVFKVQGLKIFALKILHVLFVSFSAGTKFCIMEYTEAESLFQSIRKTKHKTLFNMWVKSAVRYAQIRVEWYFSDRDGRNEIDALRSRAHNAFISNCNALSRNMNEAGEDSSWRARLGNDRKKIGDFACFIHAMVGIAAR